MKRMAQVEDGDTVMVHYTGKLGDGTVFDTTANRDPMQFRIGDGEIISRFEQAMIGMEPGESKIINVPADEAYGPHHEELVLTVGRDIFPEDAQPEVGRQFQIRQPDSQTIVAMVTDVTESSATLDANHPLAGKDLIFDIQLLEIV
jgi:peptidylprolyl isomerase